MKKFQLFIYLILLLAPANSLAADSNAEQGKKIVEFWQRWVEESGTKSSSIAISFKGELIAEAGINRSPKEPFPIASLSKAITGICILKLVEADKLGLDSKASEFLPDFDLDVTVSSLLKHDSGLKTDVTQSSLVWIADRGLENLELISRRELRKGKRDTEGSGYHYNNVNYQILGWMISEIEEKTYENACKDLVLSPIGISNAALNPAWRTLAAAGGWKLSAVDYLKFVDHYFSNKGVEGVLPTELPTSAFKGGANYGAGYFYRLGQQGGYHYWHFGAWDWRGKPKPETFGTYFAKWAHGWAVSVNYDSVPADEFWGKLDQGLWRASWQK